MLGRASDWNKFPNYVLNTQSNSKLPDKLSRLVNGKPTSLAEEYLSIPIGKQHYRSIFLPLKDVAGRNVGTLAALINMTNHIYDAKRSIATSIAISTMGVALLMVFFYWLLGRVTRQLVTNETALHRLATHDGLTGLENHRVFYLLLQEELSRSRRYNHANCLLIIDIDRFKKVNDTYGHLAGDAVLKELGHRLQAQARNVDHVFRYGGEEFAVVLPETDFESGLFVAERIREAVEASLFYVNTNTAIRVTISVGVASFPESGDNVNELVSSADKALYFAKENGRNRIASAKDFSTN